MIEGERHGRDKKVNDETRKRMTERKKKRNRVTQGERRKGNDHGERHGVENVNGEMRERER